MTHPTSRNARGRARVLGVSAEVTAGRIAAALGMQVAFLLLWLVLPGSAVLADTSNSHTQSSPEFVYAANQRLPVVSQFRVGTDGILIPLSPPAVSSGLGSLQSAVAVSRTGRFVYVANRNRNTISVFRAAKDGTLTPLAADVPAGEDPEAIAFHPSGKFMYVVCRQTISQYQVLTTGHLKPLAPASVDCPYQTRRLELDRAGQIAFAAGVGGLQSYRVMPNGALSSRSTNTAVGQAPADIAFNSQGFVYVPCLDGLYQYKVSASGELTPLSPASVRAEKLPVAIILDPTGRRVYAVSHVNNGNGTVAQYTVGADGSLTRTADALLPTGNAPIKAVLDPSGRFLYVANRSDGSVSHFAVAADGSLTLLTPTPRVLAGSLAAARHLPSFSPAPLEARSPPSGPPPLSEADRCALLQHPEFVYVANNSSDSLSEYAVRADGTLAILGVQKTGSQPKSIALDPKGRFAYVACAGNQHVWQYKVLPDGRLASLDPPTAFSGELPFSAAVTPDGRFVYVANYVDATITQFRVGSDGTLIRLGDPVKTGPRPQSVTADPSGRFVYVCDNGSSTISQFNIGPDGTLTKSSPSLDVSQGLIGAPSFSASSAYFTSTNQALLQFHVGPDGTLAPLAPERLPLTTQATNLAVEPAGQYVYASQGYDNSLAGFRIGSDSTLSALPSGLTPTGAHPGPLVADPSGHFLYVLSEDDDAVTQYRITSTGALVALTPAQVPTEKLAFLADPHTIVIFRR